jgi:hypothetical protein
MIKSGAVIQNRYLNNPYPTNYNPMGRPGNFDIVRPHDSSSVFDTGLPKDVSPYQPRVAVSVEIQPKSVFKPRRLQRQLKQVNGAKWGQTVLKSIFGGEENATTNYMAQRLLGIVEGSDMAVDTRPSERMLVDDPLLQFRQPPTSSSSSSTASPIFPDQSISQSVSDEPMDSPKSVSPEVAENLMDLSLGEAPLKISIPDQTVSPVKSAMDISPAGTPIESQTNMNDAMEAVAEVETQPIEAAQQGDLLDDTPPETMPIVQETAAGPATVRPRIRLRPVDQYLNRFDRTTAFKNSQIYGLDDPNFFDKYWQLNDYGKSVVEKYNKYLQESDPVKRKALKKDTLEWLVKISKSQGFREDPEGTLDSFKKTFPRLYNSFGFKQ